MLTTTTTRATYLKTKNKHHTQFEPTTTNKSKQTQPPTTKQATNNLRADSNQKPQTEIPTREPNQQPG